MRTHERIYETLPEIARAVKEELVKPPGKEEEPPRFTGAQLKILVRGGARQRLSR